MHMVASPDTSAAAIAANGQELKQHGTPEFPCVCYSISQAIHFPWHWHDEFECTVIRQGSVYYNTLQGHFLLQAGDGIFLNPGTLHSTEPDTERNCTRRDLLFHGRLIYGSKDSILYQKYFRSFVDPDAPPFFVLRSSVSWQADILEQIKKAARLCQNRPEGYEFTVRSLLSEILFDLYCYRAAPANEAASGSQIENERVKQMLLYLQEHYSSPVTVGHLAAQMNISERECLRCFKKILHISPIQYLIRYRIARACGLLRQPSLSILEIGSQCGFESPSYFTKTFRQVVGCTPTEYRKAHIHTSKGFPA